ncbi:hypothetical protein [Ramlibacter sp.]|uniref:hypothetical protein n=1 Tax=Ramlibacter sp. TaxID=1917967 RepID=UPI0017B30855|nr:hypothetical protein [Ramlibacter sp.]MBA2674761.1 hypothetical protein [Ramlibacter sp.]
MSANPSNDALARLNYFNGQRLAASDFRSEQAYHLGVRRLLNRSLYSAGIVKGLEVLKHPSDTHKVMVRGGLAFDHLGREIALLADAEVQVMGAPSTTKGVVFGNLLAVSYREQRTQPAQDGCMATVPGQACAGDLAWGAPTRIAADVVFEFLDSWPAADSGKVVLAQLELDATCRVERVMPGVRRYAVPVKPQQVRGVSLEGEKDIDSANPKVLYFHVDGGFPSEVTLYLRARKFSSLYYTELGRHTHHLKFNTGAAGGTPSHTHPLELGGIALAEAGEHRHEIWAFSDDKQSGAVELGNNNEGPWMLTGGGGEMGGRANMEIRPSGKHTHTVAPGSMPSKTGEGGTLSPHTHAIDQNSDPTGVQPDTRAGTALGYVDKLRVFLDGQDITLPLLQQLAAKPGQAASWAQLGDGSNGHALASPEGTGEVDLLKLGVEIGLGQHKLEFKVLQPNVGGSVQYNLYVS